MLGNHAPKIDRRYNASVDPTITNTFSSAAFRFGHTLVSNVVKVVFKNNTEVELSLSDIFFKPEVIQQYNIGPILKGLTKQICQGVDLQVVESLRSALFAHTGSPRDLASINIQRARDHGIPGYGTIVKALFPEVDTSNIDNFGNIPRNIRENLKLYNTPYDIDPWLGLLSEVPDNGSMLGRTLSTIVEDAFQRLNIGDRCFYSHQNSLTRLISRSEKPTLSNIIIANTDLDNTDIHPNCFVL